MFRPVLQSSGRLMSETGQTEKNPSRANVFRFALSIGHCSMELALRIWAMNGLARCNKKITRSLHRRRLGVRAKYRAVTPLPF